MPLAAPIGHSQVHIVLGSSHTPDEVMDRVKFFGSNGMAVRDGCWCQANGIREIEQRGSAYQVGSLARQDTKRFWEKHIIACCQAHASCRNIKCRQAQISRAGPKAVLRGEMQFAVSAVDAFGVNKQDCIVIRPFFSFCNTEDQAYLKFFSQFYQGSDFWPAQFDGPVLKMGRYVRSQAVSRRGPWQDEVGEH